jgi:hypothetical protein
MFGLFKNRERDKRIQFLEDGWGMNIRNSANLSKEVFLIDERLKKIEFLVNIPEPEYSDKPWTTTDAILKVLSSTKRELNFDQIFNSVKKYNLHVKNVSMASVKSTVYGLANKGRVDYGKDQGTFKGVSGIY